MFVQFSDARKNSFKGGENREIINSSFTKIICFGIGDVFRGETVNCFRGEERRWAK